MTHLFQTVYSSTPELNRMNLNHSVPNYGLQQHNNINSQLSGLNNNNEGHILAELQRLNLYKPPPPYPGECQIPASGRLNRVPIW